MRQLNIFSGHEDYIDKEINPRFPHSGTETSKEAAERASRPRASRDRDRILAYLKFAGPKTDEELQEALDLDANTERPRRGELVKEGLVMDSTTTSLTRSGRRATRWLAR